MTPVQIAAVAVAYLLAFARLLDAARWAWDWLPVGAQPVFPAIIAAVPLAVEAFRGVQTTEQLVLGVVVAVGAFATAIRGALPKAVYDQLDEKSQDALRVARGGTSKLRERGFVGFRTALFAALLGLLLVPFGAVIACTAAQKAVAKTAVETAAELLCSDFFSQKQGISLEDARVKFCKYKDVLDPFLEQARAAQAAAGAAVGSREPVGE